MAMMAALAALVTASVIACVMLCSAATFYYSCLETDLCESACISIFCLSGVTHLVFW